MGTRFLATPEAPVSKEHKAAILAARDGDTVASKMWDLLWGQEWPGVQVRALRNSFTDRWAGRENELVMSLDLARAELKRAYEVSDYDRIHLLAGEGSSRISSIVPAAEVVRTIVEEAEAALGLAKSLVHENTRRH